MAILIANTALYTTTRTVSVPSGTGRYLLIAWASNSFITSYVPTPSFNGNAMTLLTNAGNYPMSQLCGFAIPDNWAAGDYTHDSSSGYRRHHIILTGVDYNNPVVDTASHRQGSSTGTSSSITLNTVADSLDMSIIFYDETPFNIGTGQTALYNTTGRGAITYKASLGSGTNTMSYTYTGQRTCQSDVVLRPTVKNAGWVCII